LSAGLGMLILRPTETSQNARKNDGQNPEQQNDRAQNGTESEDCMNRRNCGKAEWRIGIEVGAIVGVKRQRCEGGERSKGTADYQGAE
jgi:hypothetical protein